jgi:small-conductance mechanosensitive channel
MNSSTQLSVLLERLSVLATRGALAVPIWAAFLLLIVFFFRGPLLTLIMHALSIRDEGLEKSIRARVDTPLQLLLITLAMLPFTILIVAPYGTFVGAVLSLMSFVLFFYMLIQSIDLAIFSWYVTKRGKNISSVVRFFVLAILYGTALLLLLDWGLGVSVLPLLATSTVLTAILGLALQDTLKNVFAGLNMSLENSFEQGDWILFKVDGNESLYGQIVEIGWRTTKIKSLNNNYIVIPNSKFTMHELVNFSRPTTRHAKTVEIPVSLKADAKQVREALERAARTTEGILGDPAPAAIPLGITATHITYQLRFWLDNLDERERLTGEVLQRCWEELAKVEAFATP